jgi:3-hydroxyisobutyrate dehydrogenase
MSAQQVGWIGTGRMGYPMAERLLRAGHPVQVWNRTRSKAEPLSALGATVHGRPADLAAVDILFTMVSTGQDLEQVVFGAGGVAAGGTRPRVVVDCSSIGVDQGEAIRARLAELGAAMIAAPVSGNAECVRAGKLSAVCSGPEAAFRETRPLIEAFAPRGVAYVGEGELARFCKIAHNVLLGVIIQHLAETAVLAEKAGVPRHAFLAFINDSVMGSIFTRYKSNALVNLDCTTTFTAELLRKDLGPRAPGGARPGRADARRRGGPGGAPGTFRCRPAETRPRGLSAPGRRRAPRNRRARGRRHARARERARPDRPRVSRRLTRGRFELRSPARAAPDRTPESTPPQKLNH